MGPGEAFQYTSGCRLRTPSGTMHGTYFCMGDDAHAFDAAISLFVLEADNGIAGAKPVGRVLH